MKLREQFTRDDTAERQVRAWLIVLITLAVGFALFGDLDLGPGEDAPLDRTEWIQNH